MGGCGTDRACNARMTAVQHYDSVSSPSLIREGKNVIERNAIVTCFGVASNNVASRRLDMSMPSEVEKRSLTVPMREPPSSQNMA